MNICRATAQRRRLPYFRTRYLTSGKSGSDDNTTSDADAKTTDTPDVPVHANLKNPIVAQLWKARHEAKQRLSLTDATQSGGSSQTTDLTKAAAELIRQGKKATGSDGGKAPRESETSIEYPFSSDEYLRETYRNPWCAGFNFCAVLHTGGIPVFVMKFCLGSLALHTYVLIHFRWYKYLDTQYQTGERCDLARYWRIWTLWLATLPLIMVR